MIHLIAAAHPALLSSATTLGCAIAGLLGVGLIAVAASATVAAMDETGGDDQNQ